MTRARPGRPFAKYAEGERINAFDSSEQTIRLVPILAWDLSGELESYRIFTAPVNVRFESGDRFEFNVQPQGERLAQPFEIAEGVVISPGSYDCAGPIGVRSGE